MKKILVPKNRVADLSEKFAKMFNWTKYQAFHYRKAGLRATKGKKGELIAFAHISDLLEAEEETDEGFWLDEELYTALKRIAKIEGWEAT